MRKKNLYLVVLLFIFYGTSIAQQLHNLSTPELIERQWIDPDHAELFSTVQVQDFQGRIKPIHTLSLELLRKIYGKSSFIYIDKQNQKQKLSPSQVFLGMQFKPDSWQLLECVKINKETIPYLKNQIKINSTGHTAVSQFFDFNGNYKIKKLVTTAYGKAPGKRSKLDKDIINIDERINILWGIFNGQFLKVFPKKDDPDQKWYSPIEKNISFQKEDMTFFSKFTNTYLNDLELGQKNKNWLKANETINLLKGFQLYHGKKTLIAPSKIDWEIWFNNQSIFLVCLISYSLISPFLLAISFIRVFYLKETKIISLVSKLLIFFLIATFFYQAFGIILRWHISGHAPWSNGYEASVFISWVTVLAGIIFSKNNLFPASTAGILATCLLGIAHGSLMNPEITNLVPVLKSYWLLIHVAIITGSYSFLSLGSLLSFISLILQSLNTFKEKTNVTDSMYNLTNINQITTTIGLFLLTAGTFLGGIWANESWGRYWGWDPKETWALISIIIYSFVLHIRIMFPKNYIYIYNVCSLFAIGSIIMTFFGVNYYLSGLHSYAKGDSFPIPKWIYIAILLCLIVSMLPLILKRFTKKPVTT